MEGDIELERTLRRRVPMDPTVMSPGPRQTTFPPPGAGVGDWGRTNSESETMPMQGGYSQQPRDDLEIGRVLPVLLRPQSPATGSGSPIGASMATTPLRAREPISLALSGGGIRAGAVASGVLCYLEGSGLAQRPGIDEISCVSGGGYAGSSYTLWRAKGDRMQRYSRISEVCV
jgi:hypothetical protein